jgi:serine protease inhibitor
MHLAATNNTRQQLTNVYEEEPIFETLLEVQKMYSENPIAKMANCCVINDKYHLKTEYLKQIEQLAMIFQRNFSKNVQVAKECNDFIEQGTKDLIKNIVNPEMITMDTILLLINTLYFKTVWNTPFKKNLTTNKLFDNKMIVPMMKQMREMPYFEDDHVQMIELFYKEKDYGFVVVLPKDIDLKQCADYLFNGVTFYPNDIDCEIPRFTQRKQTNLKPLFQKMGVTDIFSSGDAMLTNMSDDKIYVSDAIHEAVVIVDEEGTEAAAVTVIKCMNESCTMEPEYIQFYAHKPFCYGIRHRSTNKMLFVGDYHGDN